MNDNVIISAKDLKMYFGGGVIKALDGVSTDIHEGEVVVVIGPSGSGKSTFLRCLNQMELPSSGTIYFTPLADLRARKFKRITISAP